MQTNATISTEDPSFILTSSEAEDPMDQYTGMAAALAAAVLASLNGVAVRYVTTEGLVTPVVIAFYSGICGLGLSVIFGLSFSTR